MQVFLYRRKLSLWPKLKTVCSIHESNLKCYSYVNRLLSSAFCNTASSLVLKAILSGLPSRLTVSSERKQAQLCKSTKDHCYKSKLGFRHEVCCLHQ